MERKNKNDPSEQSTASSNPEGQSVNNPSTNSPHSSTESLNKLKTSPHGSTEDILRASTGSLNIPHSSTESIPESLNNPPAAPAENYYVNIARNILEKIPAVQILSSLWENPFIHGTDPAELSATPPSIRKNYAEKYEKNIRQIETIREDISSGNILLITASMTIFTMLMISGIPPLGIFVSMLIPLSVLLIICGLSTDPLNTATWKYAKVNMWLLLLPLFVSEARTILLLPYLFMVFIYFVDMGSYFTVENIISRGVMLCLFVLLLTCFTWLPYIPYNFLQMFLIQVLTYLLLISNITLFDKMLIRAKSALSDKIRILNSDASSTSQSSTGQSAPHDVVSVEEVPVQETGGILYSLRVILGVEISNSLRISATISAVIIGLLVFGVLKSESIILFFENLKISNIFSGNEAV